MEWGSLESFLCDVGSFLNLWVTECGNWSTFLLVRSIPGIILLFYAELELRVFWMSLFHVLGFGLKVGHLLWLLCCSIVSLISSNWVFGGGLMGSKTSFLGEGGKVPLNWLEKVLGNVYKIHHHYYHNTGSKKVGKTWWRKLLFSWIILWSVISLWVFWGMSSQAAEKRKETLASMCDERARMLQDQFNVSMNHVQAMSILISTFHHGKNPSAIDQVDLLSN